MFPKMLSQPSSASQRRRHNRNLFSGRDDMIPVITAVLIGLLLLLAFLAFLAPEAEDWDGHNHYHHNHQFEIGGRSSSGDLWSSKLAKYYYGCSNASSKFVEAAIVTKPNRYLMIATSGGLLQQWTGIADAVVAAHILNATLVIPKLDQKSFWKNASNFTEIFDVEWFIRYLSKDVKIVKELPSKGGKVMGAYTMHVPRKCTPSCYIERVLPVLLKKHAVELAKFDYRLANKLDPDLQKLRCRVSYHALRFTNPILEMGKKLVNRMRTISTHFIALHLRFDPDMLAFSGCYYGGGTKERRELGWIRRRWKTLNISNPEKNRRHGKCPLTPEEVGLMLRALGFGSDVHIYVASREVYGWEATLAPLKALFPNYHSKKTILRNELEPFSSSSSSMAALDFIVFDESDIFVTNYYGNMAKMLAGRRRYFGHKRTIRPNAKKLNSPFQSQSNMTWEIFASKVRTVQKGFMGEPNEVRPGRGEFYENPSTCICEDSEAKAKADSGLESLTKLGPENEKGNDEVTDNQFDDEEIGWSDMDYGDNKNAPQEKEMELANITDLDYIMSVKSDEQSELEDLLSD